MAKKVSASDAKNNFGGLLEDVAALGRIDILKHGRLVAVVLSPRALESVSGSGVAPKSGAAWGHSHMIPPESARAARRVREPDDFNED